MDRLYSAKGIHNMQDSSVISQVLLFFLRLAYLQKEEDLSLNYICSQTTLIQGMKKRVPGHLLDYIHNHQHKRVRL